MYVCMATDGSSTVTNNFYVGLAPYIITAPSDQQTMINDTVVFYCSAAGFPIPNITWERVSDTFMLPGTISDEIPSDASHTRMSILNISSVAGTDYGDYECIASISDFTLDNVNISATDDIASATLSGRASKIID